MRRGLRAWAFERAWDSNRVPLSRDLLAVVTDDIWDEGYGNADVGVHGDGEYPVE